MSYNNFNNLKYSKSNLCRSKGHQCYFFILFLSFCFRVIRKGLRKNSEIFVNLRRSSGQSMRERSDRWPLFLVFKSVPGCIEGIPGHYGMLRVLWDVPGVFRGCSRLFRGCSGGVPGCSGVFRGVPGVFRVLQTPIVTYPAIRQYYYRRWLNAIKGFFFLSLWI